MRFIFSLNLIPWSNLVSTVGLEWNPRVTKGAKKPRDILHSLKADWGWMQIKKEERKKVRSKFLSWKFAWIPSKFSARKLRMAEFIAVRTTLKTKPENNINYRSYNAINAGRTVEVSGTFFEVEGWDISRDSMVQISVLYIFLWLAQKSRNYPYKIGQFRTTAFGHENWGWVVARISKIFLYEISGIFLL